MEEVENLVLPLVGEEGMELVDVSYRKEGANWILRLSIDKPEGIKIGDCKRINTRAVPILDKANVIRGRYLLEVSSPGLERPLKNKKDFLRFKGSLVRIKTYSPIDNQKVFVAILKDYRQDKIILAFPEGRMVEIPVADIAKANLEFKYKKGDKKV
jgi:ribosome maturation factor RimP